MAVWSRRKLLGTNADVQLAQGRNICAEPYNK
jgi:hypothetical protein